MKSIEVKTVNLQYLKRKFGQFDFIKWDIEGMDREFLKQLIDSEKPRYVSIEFISSEWLEYLSQCGYQNFKVINNAYFRRFTPTLPISTIAGDTLQWKFMGATSGPFGEDLPGDWVSIDIARNSFLQWKALKEFDETLVLDNWFDLHAKHCSAT